MTTSSARRRALRGALVTALTVAALAAAPTAASAQTNPFQRGPNPTEASI